MTPDDLNDALAHQHDLRDVHRKNLRVLEQQRATFTDTLVPPHIVTGIDTLNAQIAACDLALATLESQRVQATPADPRFGPGTRRAVVVGIGHAPHAPHLPVRQAAVSTAQDLAALLAAPAARFALPKGTILLDEAAKTGDIQNVILDALDAMAVNDVLLVSFCGSACLLPDGSDLMVVTADYHSARAAAKPGRYLALSWLRDEVLQVHTPGHVVVVLDCHYVAANGAPVEPAALRAQLASLLDVGDMPPDQTRLMLSTLPNDDRFGRVVTAVFRDPPGGLVTVRKLWERLERTLGDSALRVGVAGAEVVLAVTPSGVTAVSTAVSRDQQAIQVAARHEESTRLLQVRLQGFVGRETERAAIRTLIDAMRPTGGYVLIKALAGEGKSSVIAKLIAEAGVTDTPHHMIPLTPGPQHQLAILRAIVAQLILKHSLSTTYFPEESYPAMKDLFASILRQLHEQGVAETLYLDGLDQLEADHTGLRDLSFLPPQPPPGIVIILGSRPDETLRPLDPLQKRVYALPPLSRADFQVVLQDHALLLRVPDVAQIYDALSGNALYLILATHEIKKVPDADWHTFVERIAVDPRSLFTIALDRIERGHPVLWERVIKPVLAVLVVAQEPLTTAMLRSILNVDPHDLRRSLERLGGLVSRSTDGRYGLYHLKLREYLIEPLVGEPERDYLFATDTLVEWHQQLAAWCIPHPQDEPTIWDDTSGGDQERRVYARYHYVAHLALGRQWEALKSGIDAGRYGEHKRQFDPSSHLYAQDLDRARDVALEQHDLARLWRWSLLRVNLSSQMDQWPDTLFTTLVYMNRAAEALSRVELVSKPEQRVGLLCHLATHLTGPYLQDAWQRAHIVINTMAPGPQRLVAQRLLARALMNAGEIAQARDVIDTIPDRPWQARLVRELAQVLITTGRLTEAQTLATSIQDTFQQAIALRQLAQALAQARNLTQAHAVTVLIPEHDHQIRALASLGAAIMAQDPVDAARMFSQAYALLDTIRDPYKRARAFSGIAEAMIQVHHEEGSLAITRAHDGALAIPSASLRVRALRELIQDLSRAHAFSQAHMVAGSIPDPVERVQALSNLAQAMVLANDPSASAVIVQAHGLTNTISSLYARARVLATVTQVMVRMQHPDVRLALVNARTSATMLPDPAQQAFALRSLVQTLAAVGAVTESSLVAEAIRDTDERAIALSDLACIMAQGHHPSAIATFTQARALADNIPTATQPLRAIMDLMVIVTTSDLDQISGITASIPDQDDQAQILATLATALIAAGALKPARIVADAIPYAYQRASVLAHLSIALIDADSLHEAAALAAGIVDAYEQARVLTALTTAFVQKGLADEALAIATSIPRDNQRVHALAQAAAALALHQPAAAATQFILARRIADTIRDPSDHAHAIAGMAAAMATSQPGEAMALFAQARAAAESIQDLSALARTRARIAAAMAPYQGAEATALFAQARAAAEILREPREQAQVLIDLAAAVLPHQHTEAGIVFTQASMVARRIRDGTQRAQALTKIAEGWIALGQHEQAFTIARAIPTLTQRVEMIQFLHGTLLQHADRSVAMARMGAFWREATTREELLAWVHLAFAMLSSEPQLAPAIRASFAWVEKQLQEQHSP